MWKCDMCGRKNEDHIDPCKFCGSKKGTILSAKTSNHSTEKSMNPRPSPVTAISWIMIIIGIIGLIGWAISTVLIDNPVFRESMGKGPIPIPVQIIVGYIGPLIFITSGTAMLNGHNWGRIIYFVFSIIGFLFGAINHQKAPIMALSILFFILAVFCITSPGAKEYFSQKDIDSGGNG